MLLLISTGGPPTLSRATEASADLNSFISSCLQKDANLRPSASEILLHPFLQSQDHAVAMKNLLLEYAQAKVAMDAEKERKLLENRQLRQTVKEAEVERESEFELETGTTSTKSVDSLREAEDEESTFGDEMSDESE